MSFIKTNAMHVNLAIGMVCAAGACSSHAQIGQHTFKEYMRDTAQPDFYWPFENSFISDLGTDNERHRAIGVEQGGIYFNDCSNTTPIPAELRVVETDYFPILPDHVTGLGASSALILGETNGDLGLDLVDGVNRYLEFDFATDMLTEFGMNNKNEWTMHMVVSPADDEFTRGWETIFDVGNPDFVSQSGAVHPVKVTVRANRQFDRTVFELKTEAQGQPVISTIEVLDTDALIKDGRRWFQVVVQYYTDHSNYDIEAARLLVNSVEAELQSGPVLNKQIVSMNSNQWRSQTPSIARIGLDVEGNNPFHGAIQHFAIWKSLLDTDYNVMTQVDSLADAFRGSSVNLETDQRTPMIVDWDQAPRYFFWDIPNEQTLSGFRNLLNWNDPIWAEPNTYPLTRVYYDQPNSTSRTPVGIQFGDGSVQLFETPVGQTPADIARQTANWIQYINAGLGLHNKSLNDPNACALLWQNWGGYKWNDPNALDCFYQDAGAARAITKNWRDVPTIWRNSLNHPVLSTHADTDRNQITELDTPFYREGMSQNAFRSKDVFIELAKIIANSNGVIPTPSRLHFDTEQISNINNVWLGSVDGWWGYATTSDSRASDSAQWVPPSVSIGYSTLSGLAASFPNATNYTQWNINNNDWAKAMSRFSRDQYDAAFGLGVGLPAIEELNPNIRLSEYNMTNAGSQIDGQDYARSSTKRPAENIQLNWLDFSSPVLYPISGGRMQRYGSKTMVEWAEYFDRYNQRTGTRVHDLLNTSSITDVPYDATLADLAHDSSILFIENAKYMLNANYLASGGENGTPIVPWLPYPEETSFKIKEKYDVAVGPEEDLVSDGLGDGVIDEHDEYTIILSWQDIAKVAVFAHRHGVREFIFWGDTGGENANSNGNVPDIQLTTEGLEHIVQTVDLIEATTPFGYTTSADFTTTAQGFPMTGVPDGVVDTYDHTYYLYELYAKGDLAADIAGPNAPYPDGVVDMHDLTYFELIYGASNYQSP